MTVYHYCEAADVTPLLGDLLLPDAFDIDGVINKASADVTLYLGQRYVLPLPTSNAFTMLLLQEATSEIAAAYTLLALATPGEDNRINAYGKHLWDRAQGRLMPYMAEIFLPGAAVIPTSAAQAGGPVAVFNKDLVSVLDNYYDYTSVNPSRSFPLGPLTEAYGIR